MAKTRIIVCNTLHPFVTGGSELFAAKLTEQLNEAGHQAILVTFPFQFGRFRKDNLVRACTPWESLDLSKMADVVIPLRFPTWLVQHPNKIVYLNHQLRIAYDLFDTPYGPSKNSDTQLARKYVMAADTALAKAKKIFAVSRNVQQRLKRFNKLDSELLYHGLPLEERHYAGNSGDYILSVGRLVSMKRVDLLIKAMEQTKSGVKCYIVGDGMERPKLENLIAECKLQERVQLLGWVSDEKLIELYANSLGVYYAPVDEDYGLVTLEAFKSSKPILTTTDSGGVLEFVQDGMNGKVLPSEPKAFAEAIDLLYNDRALSLLMGTTGAETIKQITWQHCIRRLEDNF